MNKISRFNPYLMDNNLIIKLNTGREKDFDFVLDIIKKNIKRKDSIQHILINGSRGMGKSFFLKLMDIKLNELNLSDFVLLPEEQVNIYQPVDLIREIKKHFIKQEHSTSISNWFPEDNEVWNKEINELEKLMLEVECSHLVVGLENFDLLLGKGGAFESDENQYMLREFLTRTTSITLIATTIYPDLGSDYDKALFHFFAKHELQAWQEENHKDYFIKRIKLESSENQRKSELSESQLKALIKFTGGSPRITVIMADILADNNLDSTTKTLEKVIDDLTPFYQDLLSKIPPKSRLLFDSLIRGGEPCSQSDLADRVNAKQNLISQGFGWLVNNNYLMVDSPLGVKQKLYSVKDRLFVHFYQMRYINHGTGKSILASMSEFLTRFYNTSELKNKAIDLYEKGFKFESNYLIKLAFEQSNLDMDKLPWKDDFNALIKTFEFTNIEETQDSKKLEAILKTHNKDLENFVKSKNLEKQIKKQEEIGWCLRKLNRQNESIEVLNKTLTYLNEEKNSQEYSWVLVQIALCKYELNLYEEAIKYFNNSLNFYIKENNKEDQAFILLHLSFCFEYLENYENSLELRQNSINLYKEIGYIKNKEQVNSIKISMALLLFQQKKYKETLDFFDEIIQSSIENKDFKYNPFIFLFKGICLSELNMINQALDTFKKSIEICIKNNDLSYVARNYNQIGVCLKKQESYGEALEAFEKSLEYSQENTEKESILKNIGICLAQLNKHSEALSFYYKSLDFHITKENSEEKVLLHNQIGFSLGQLGKNKEALEELNISLKISYESQNIEWQAINLRIIGGCLTSLGKYEDSIDKYNKALDILDKITNIYNENEIAWNYRQRGFSLEQLEKYSEALESYEKSMTYYSKDNRIQEHKAWILRHKGICLLGLKKYTESLSLFRESLSNYIMLQNIEEQAFILGNIGFALSESGFYEESLNSLNQALEINIIRKDLKSQADNLQEIAFNLGRLSKYDEAIEKFIKSNQLYNIVNDTIGKARNNRGISISMWQTSRQDEAINILNESLDLYIKENNITELISGLWQLSNYQNILKQYEKAINTLNNALKLLKENNKNDLKFLLIAELFKNYILFGKDEEAWNLLDENISVVNNNMIFSNIGSVLFSYSEKNEIAKYYSIGRKILEYIYNRKDKLIPYVTLQQLFFGLLSNKVNLLLVEDLLEDSIIIFEENIKMELSGISGIILYLKSNKSINILLNMEPDIRKTVEILVKEMNL
ncbi:MAG: tetratricopeptide repeat protein [Cyanobacteriota bacterium]